MSFSAYWEQCRERLDARVTGLLEREEPALREALGPALEGGKRFRPTLVLLVHDALEGHHAEVAEDHALALELIHTATLIHDDLVDDDAARRGRPAMHVRLGAALAGRAAGARTGAGGLAVLAGDAALAWGVAHLGSDAAVKLTARALRDVWLGVWEEALPGQDGYERVARRKTASLFRLACELGALAARASPGHADRAARYGEALGLAYQFADDAVDRPAGAPPRSALEPRARAMAAEARALAQGFPQAPCRALLGEAPRALLEAVLAAPPGGWAR